MRVTMTLIPLALALVACGDDPVEPAADDGTETAEGEVLGGTISDEMIQLDDVRSQSPPLNDTPPAEDEGGDDPEQ